MNYRDQLPENCPPDEAEEIAVQLLVFRLVRHSPPNDDDFQSQRAERPEAQFRVSECQACGLSVFLDRRDCERANMLPKLRNLIVCQVTLEPGSGSIQQTGLLSHHTYWPCRDFDILSHCAVESE